MNTLAVLALPGVAAAPGATRAGSPVTASLRVSNGTAELHPFTVRGIDPATHIRRNLAPGETLCLVHAGRGVVATFETPESLEGWSRLVPEGGWKTLLGFGRFDRCASASRDG